MLREITIENVAVIEKATAEFENGFNVLTGETGAGKSILIDSINAILGNRTSRDIVRSGAAKASIWASFQGIAPAVCEQLRKAGYESDGELLLHREISADGKSSCRINGAPATAAMLREVCGGLINIHGQHDNQSLLNPAKHLSVLDDFAENTALRTAYGDVYGKLAETRRRIDALRMDEGEKARKLDLLRYEVNEIEAAGLQPGEEEALQEQRNRIRHAQTIVQALNSTYMALTGGDEDIGAAALLGEAAGEINAAAQYAPDLAAYTETLNELYYSASEVASDVQKRLTDFEFDGSALDEVEHRLDTLYRLGQKYGGSAEAVFAYGERARAEMESIELSDEELERLAGEEKRLFAQAQQLADKLSTSRQNAFGRLNEQMTEALAFLNMPDIVLALQHKQGALGPAGWDELEFYISTNPGEAPKPMAKIASGGELARIMLALKSALADRDDVATVIYDEIDTGVSGLAAGRIGQLLQQTAAGRQVVCVTHTAQIAACAQHHLLIEKQVEGGRTFTHIRALDRAGRREELARVISGDKVTDLARANAEEMLRMASGNLIDYPL